MGTLVANFFIALDDVVEAPDQWHFDYFDDRMGQAVGQGMEGTEAFLLGHRLYDEWSQYWPAQGPDVPFSEFINGIDKYVVASSGFEPTWQSTTVLHGDDLVDQVHRLKASTAGKISMSGCATTVRWLLAEGLLDELHLLMHPVAVGSGARLFDGVAKQPLRLLSHEAFPTGVLHLVYAPA